MKRIALFTFLLIQLVTKAQDPVSSQFYFNQLYLNPAFAGINHSARFGGTYRNQWTAIPSKFVTYNCWADIYTPSMFQGGLGIMAMQDISGEGFLKTTSVGIIQSYEFILPNKIARLRTGYNVTITNKKIDWSKLVFSDQLDGIHGNVNTSSVSAGNPDGKTFADIDAGLILEFRKIQKEKFIVTQSAGYAANHLTQPNESLLGTEYNILPMKHTMHYTLMIELRDDKSPWFVSPNIIYERQGTTPEKGVFPYNKKSQFSTLNLGIYLMHKPLVTGFFYRKRSIAKTKDRDSFICFLGVYLETSKTSIVKIGYSYDFTINNLASNTSGSHEISLSMEFKDFKLISKKAQMRKRNKRVMDCTDFGDHTMLF
ncbi:MAG: hypothetical protein K0S44_289 [Bacteroidetes bacterium]|jgi:type IX secretion system PorP/SprF family membrane protein|nr:hypothetical protein [Bacteroidota bacterium]